MKTSLMIFSLLFAGASSFADNSYPEIDTQWVNNDIAIHTGAINGQIMSGTGMATPVVSAHAAQLKLVNPELTNEQIVALLKVMFSSNLNQSEKDGVTTLILKALQVE